MPKTAWLEIPALIGTIKLDVAIDGSDGDSRYHTDTHFESELFVAGVEHPDVDELAVGQMPVDPASHAFENR